MQKDIINAKIQARETFSRISDTLANSDLGDWIRLVELSQQFQREAEQVVKLMSLEPLQSVINGTYDPMQAYPKGRWN